MSTYNNYEKWLKNLKKGDRVIVRSYSAFKGTTTYMTYVEQSFAPYFLVVDGINYNYRDGFNAIPSLNTMAYNQLIQPY